MKKSLVVLGVCLAVLVFLSSAACLYISALSMGRIRVIEEAVTPKTAADDNQENDVTIAGQYVIRSTKNISDAYLNGTKDELTDKEKETLDMASAVLEKIITEGMSDYEKELAVYQWMTKNLTHDPGLLLVIPTTQEDCDNPYGVLKYNNAVCVGYATTFRLFMEMLEIPCMVVHNSEFYHSWDLVQLNGHWYHTDIYSDAGTSNYAHFNCTDYMQQTNNDWNRDFFPQADSYEFCYAYVNAVKETNVYNVPKIVRDMINNEGKYISINFGKDINELQAHMAERMLGDISSILSNSYKYSNTYLNWNWISTDGGFLLCITFNSDGQGYDNFDDEALNKMQKALDKSFGDIMY